MLLLSPVGTLDPTEQVCEWHWRYQDEQGALISGEVGADDLPSLVTERPDWFDRPDRVALVLPSADVLYLSCLLYTSPSPRD